MYLARTKMKETVRHRKRGREGKGAGRNQANNLFINSFFTVSTYFFFLLFSGFQCAENWIAGEMLGMPDNCAC